MTTVEAAARWGRSTVRHKIAHGHWQQPARGVIVTHNGPLTPDQQVEVALLSCRGGAALGGLSALTLDGLRGFPPEAIHIVLPAGTRPRPQPTVVHHFSTQLGPDAVHPARTPRRTWFERSLIDAASWSTRPRFVRVLVIAAFQQRLTNVTRMREMLTTRGTCRHRALIAESILDAHGGTQSLPERDFTQICQLAELPPPTRQHRVQGRSGHYFLDAHWEQFGFGAEIHGIPHHDIAHWDEDLLRANEVVIAGPTLLMFSSYATRHEPFEVACQLTRMARSRGWNGPTPDPARFSAAFGDTRDSRLWSPRRP